MLYLTSRDNDIMKYLEKYKGVTIQQAGLMFFPKNQYNYTYARQRLRALHDKKYLKFFSNNTTGEYIYYNGEEPTKMLSHNTFAMNVYAHLVYYNARILYYNKNEAWLDRSIISDGFVIYQFADRVKAAIIECDINHKTEDKYERLYQTGILQEKYGDFPLVIIMSKYPQDNYSDNFTIINMDLKCTNFVEKVLSL